MPLLVTYTSPLPNTLVPYTAMRPACTRVPPVYVLLVRPPRARLPRPLTLLLYVSFPGPLIWPVTVRLPLLALANNVLFESTTPAARVRLEPAPNMFTLGVVEPLLRKTRLLPEIVSVVLLTLRAFSMKPFTVLLPRLFVASSAALLVRKLRV